ncbi:UDP-N-acetylglucosamine 1-carboxyvinyltransferase protein [Dioscorea alata]|uniref:UDP-N-acetylglucosamine 1-carboxyvinyltransferase protein n=1 Tax=Dioscorea alata TaxID=55571 RepID=A0ACB7TVB1_DIOAL|nr:UDP-N-acetylglucosamine 1-carboxyvinyltransferase protein [Dioscorea alata]
MALFSLPLSLPCLRTPLAIPTKNETSISSPQTLVPDQKLVISGGLKLSGHAQISGSKNSALAVLAGTLCCSDGPSLIRGLPDLADTRTMAEVLVSLGAKVEEMGGGDLVVDARELSSVEPCEDAIGRIRAGFFVLGPLVARFGEAEVSLPGGCRIGARPIDLYLRGLEALGANVQLRMGKSVFVPQMGEDLLGLISILVSQV